LRGKKGEGKLFGMKGGRTRLKGREGERGGKKKKNFLPIYRKRGKKPKKKKRGGEKKGSKGVRFARQKKKEIAGPSI